MCCKECKLTKGHKMDCSGNFKKSSIIHTPAILYVKDEKHHVICHTIIDYEKIDEMVASIKDILERNHWRHEISVLPSEEYFTNTLVIKDRGL